MGLYKSVIKPVMFGLDAEKAHRITVNLFNIGLSIPGINTLIRDRYRSPMSSGLEKDLCGLKFPNPVGLAAGFDKDGRYYRQMAALGFGLIEIGTVTPRPQQGNPKPRLFRLPEDKALINRMGFNNDGVIALKKRLEKRTSGKYVLAANIGKNKDTPNEDAVKDYVQCFKELHALVDFFVLNVSSPNTPGLRELQEEKPLRSILSGIQEENAKVFERKPIFLKIAPDLDERQLNAVIKSVHDNKVDGIIATNTTLSRSNLKTAKEEVEKIGNGGLSGFPLAQRAYEILKFLRGQTAVPIISVGGIHNSEEALRRLDAGADLIQLYSGLIYEGPRLVRDINERILKRKR